MAESSGPSELRRWVATMAAGKIPGSPGTFGSALTGLILFGVWHLLRAMQSPPWAWTIALVAGLVLFSGLCVIVGRWAVVDFGKKDPGPFVLDEAAGMCLTMLLLPQWPGVREAWVILGAFVAFRVFDISKPPPCKQLEKLPGGWGILMDDLAAAVYANIACQLVFRLVIHSG